MIKVGTLAKIRRLYFRDKQSIKEICRQTGMSRNTVRSWLRDPEMVEPKYPVRVVVSKLLIRPCEVSSGITYAAVLKVANNPLWILL